MARFRPLVIIAVFFLLYLTFFSTGKKNALRSDRSRGGKGAEDEHDIRIGKASMLYGARNELLERAIASHDRHNEIFGYSMHILRIEVTQGFWNKLAHLQNLIWLELQKPQDVRLHWIAWFEPDVVILNPNIPLDLFLPPADHEFRKKSLIASRLPSGTLNTGVFLIRVDRWSLRFLVKAMALPMLDSEVRSASEDETLEHLNMASVLNETSFRDAVFYEPHTWFNTVQTNGTSIIDAQEGTFSIQIPAALEGDRWKMMDKIINELNASPTPSTRHWGIPLSDTIYVKETKAFWARMTKAQDALRDAETLSQSLQDYVPAQLTMATDYLRELILFEPDHENKIDIAVALVKKLSDQEEWLGGIL